MYGLLIPPVHPLPVPVHAGRADDRSPPAGAESRRELDPASDAALWPAPPRPIERELDPEC